MKKTFFNLVICVLAVRPLSAETIEREKGDAFIDGKQVVAEKKINIPTLLKARYYPEKSWPEIERELKMFLKKIDLLSFEKKVEEAKETPQGLRDLAQELGETIDRLGYREYENPHQLLKLLVNSLGKDDIEAIIDNSPLSRREKEKNKKDKFACSALAQLVSIVFEILGIDARATNSTSHIFITVPAGEDQMVFVDVSNMIFEIVDLFHWYRQEGQVWNLKDEQRLAPNDVSLILDQWGENGHTTANLKEMFNLLYLNISFTSTEQITSVIYSNRGLAYLDMGDLPRALEDYNHALAINPNLTAAYNNRGLVYSGKGDLPRALEDYNHALAINPNDADVYINRGLVYAGMGDLTLAIEDYTHALSINPNVALAYFNRGNAYSDREDFILAMADFSQALAINPNDGQTYNNRAVIYYQQGQYDKAWKDVRSAQALGTQVKSDFLNALRQATGEF